MISHGRRLLDSLRRRPLLALGLLGALAVLGPSAYLGGRHLWAWSQQAAGEAALRDGDLARARTHLEACLQVWPRSAKAQLLALRAARRAGLLDEAEQRLRACQELEGVTEETALEWALLEVQRGRLGSVEDFLRTRLEAGGPDVPLILEVLTAELMRTNRLVEAQRYLDQWLEVEPHRAAALVSRGWVAEHLFDNPAALKDYLEALALNPDDDAVRLRVAEILERTARSGEALEHLERLRLRRPQDVAVVLCLARCRGRLGQGEEARQLLDAALAEHPDDAQMLAERGRLALQQGRPDEAEPWLRQAAELSPYDRQIVYSFYECLQQLGKKEAAQELADRLTRIDADQRRMGQLMREVTSRPYDADLRCEVGTIFLRNGFSEDGLKWLGTALEANPTHRAAHEALAEHFERNGEPARAAEHRRAAARVSGKPPEEAGPRE